MQPAAPSKPRKEHARFRALNVRTRVLCLTLKRATLTPASMSAAIAAASRVAGPTVATIFVARWRGLLGATMDWRREGRVRWARPARLRAQAAAGARRQRAHARHRSVKPPWAPLNAGRAL